MMVYPTATPDLTTATLPTALDRTSGGGLSIPLFPVAHREVGTGVKTVDPAP